MLSISKFYIITKMDNSDTAKKYLPLALAALCALVFLPSLFNGFTNWDDQLYVTQNPLITSLAPGNIWHIFTSFHRGLYKPLVFLSFALEYHFFGLNPAVYHVGNLFFHICNAVLVYFFFLLVAKERRLAFVGALLFALHPLRVESVAWIPERKDMLCAFFALCSLLCHVQSRLRGDKKLSWCSVALLGLSLLANAKAVAFPFIIIITDIYAGYASAKKALRDSWPYFALAVAFAGLNYMALRGAAVVGQTSLLSWSDICVAAYGLLIYIGKTLWPLGLAVIYPYPRGYPATLPLIYWFAPVLAVILIWFFVRIFRRERTALFGGAFFLIYIFPFLQWLPVQPGVAMEHLTYFPAIGLSLAMAQGGFMVYDRFENQRAALKIFFIALLMVLCFLTFQRTKVWRDSFTLWNDRLAGHPDSYLAYTNRGMAYCERGEWQRAVADFDRAVELNPKFRAAFVKRGYAWFALNRLDAAFADAQHALDISYGMMDRRDAFQIITEACSLKGNIYLHRGDAKAALASFDSALASEPDYAYALAGKGQLAMMSGEYPAAVDLYYRAASNAPLAPDMWNSLGAAQSATGAYPAAFDSFDKALLLNPAYGAAHFNKAAACLNYDNLVCARAELSAAQKTGFKADANFVAMLGKFEKEKAVSK